MKSLMYDTSVIFKIVQEDKKQRNILMKAFNCDNSGLSDTYFTIINMVIKDYV